MIRGRGLEFAQGLKCSDTFSLCSRHIWTISHSTVPLWPCHIQYLHNSPALNRQLHVYGHCPMSQCSNLILKLILSTPFLLLSFQCYHQISFSTYTRSFKGHYFLWNAVYMYAICHLNTLPLGVLITVYSAILHLCVCGPCHGGQEMTSTWQQVAWRTTK